MGMSLRKRNECHVKAKGIPRSPSILVISAIILAAALICWGTGMISRNWMIVAVAVAAILGLIGMVLITPYRSRTESAKVARPADRLKLGDHPGFE